MEDLHLFAQLNAGKLAILTDLDWIFGAPPATVVQKEYQWISCVIWDDRILKEFKEHEEYNCKMHTKMSFGRALHNCLVRDFDNFGLLQQINWKESFILVDIINTKLGTCGNKKCLRVCETPTWNNSHIDASPRAKIWDLVIFPECTELVEEMSSKTKTTVAVWNCNVHRYPQPYIDDKDVVLGEIFIRTAPDDKILTVVLFHHEMVTECKMPQETDGKFGLIQKYSIFKVSDNGEENHLVVFGGKQNPSMPVDNANNGMLMEDDENQIEQLQNNRESQEDEKDGNSDASVYFDSHEIVLETEQASGVSMASSTDVLQEVRCQLRTLSTLFIKNGRHLSKE